VEVKIGVQFSAREIVLESGQSPEDIERLTLAALDAGGLLSLSDDKGRRVLVPVDKLAYIELGEQLERRVGFGAM